MSVDPCAAYVSMLRARRLEEEKSRKRRSERRADYSNANLEKYQAKERSIGNFLMHCKLRALSQVEEDLFDMLDEQAQWRHVMKQNVESRDAQRAMIDEEQKARLNEHLQHVLQQEVDAYRVGRDDDNRRHKAMKKAGEQRAKSENFNICAATLNDITTLAFKAIDFIEAKQVQPVPGVSAFDRIPKVIFDDMKFNLVYGANDTEEVHRRLVEDHVTLHAIGTPSSGPAFSHLLHLLMNRVSLALHPPAEPLRPLVPTSKAFIVLSGPKFSGKSTAAQAIASELGLDYVSDVTVVAEVLAALEGEITTSDITSHEATERLSLGREVRVLLQEGRDIDETLMSRLALFKIKYVAESSAGILFDGLPRTAVGFEIVEAALSGYHPNHGKRPEMPLLTLPGSSGANLDEKLLDVERPPPPPQEAVLVGGKEAKKPDPKAAAKKDKKKDEVEDPLPPIELPPADPVPPLTAEEESILEAAKHDTNVAGLQRVIRIHCDPEVIFDRYCGLRVDAETGVEYHVVTEPPPLDRIPFVAAKDRSDANTAKLHASIENDANTWNATAKWLSVYEGVLNVVEGNVPAPELVQSVRQLVNDALETARTEFETLEAAKSLKQERLELEQLHTERVAHREAVRKQIAQLYTERGIDPLPAELAEAPKPPEDPWLPVPSSTPAVLNNMLKVFARYYEGIVLRVHTELSRLLNDLYDHGVWATGEFNTFCDTPDGKQKLIDAFVKDLNGMAPALRRDVQGKDELHLRGDGLLEALRGVVDKRREEGSALVESLLSPAACIDPWCEGIRLLGSVLVQLEVERMLVVRHIAATYYGGIKCEPIPIDEHDQQIDVLLQIKSVAESAAAAEAAKGGAKDAKAKAPAPKKGQPAAAPVAHDEVKAHEDHIAPLLEKATASMRGVVDKLTTPVTAAAAVPAKGGKAPKAATEAPPPVPEGPTASTLCVPLVTSELDAAKFRVQELGKFIRSLQDRGIERNNAVRAKLSGLLKQRIIDEMSAVNGCLYYLRCAIEEEATITAAVLLEGAKFTIDEGRFIAPRPAPTLTSSGDNRERRGPSPTAMVPETITSALNSKRAMELVRLFKAIAPSYTVYAEDFANIVTAADWATTTSVASVDVVFKRFDTIGCGAIDWREFMIHLVLWSEPLSGGHAGFSSSGAFAGESKNPLYIDGPTLLQLFDLKTDLGMVPLTYEQFVETELYFEVQVDPNRLAAVKDILWETFSVNETLDPNDFVMFLCADEQPLRGVQKAFAMGAAVGDEVCNLTVDMLHKLLHYSACNCQAFGMEDKYSYEELETLYAAANVETVNFQDMCAIGAGRVMLNNTTSFRRKKFTETVK